MKQFKKALVAGIALTVSLSVYADSPAPQQGAMSQMQTMNQKQLMKMNQKQMKMRRKSSFSDMTPAQKQKIKQIVDSMKIDMKQTIMQLRQGRKNMSSFILGSSFDDAKAQAYAQEQGKLYAKMVYMRMKTRHQIYQVMTPAQQQKLKASMMQRQNRMMNKMNPKKLGQ